MNEQLERTALVLEGGGMRGLFTAGVLDFFLEQKLHFDDCLAVSAGVRPEGARIPLRHSLSERQTVLQRVQPGHNRGSLRF